MENNIVNAYTLFLLCALRKEPVVAINQSSYDWTFRHYAFAMGKAMSDPQENKSFRQRIEDYEDEARREIPSQERKQRRFSFYESDMGFTLCDTDEDLSWFAFGISHDQSSNNLTYWAYHGNFILSEPLTEKERFIITNFGRKLE